MNNISRQINISRLAGEAKQALLWLICGVILLLVVAAFFLFQRPDSEPVPAPGDSVAMPPASKEARGDAARDIIAELQNTASKANEQEMTAGEESVDDESMAGESGDDESMPVDSADEGAMNNEQAYARAQAFQAEGKLADAQLLYFFAARGGYAPAAFDLATFYDPNHFAKETSLMNDPDPFQAYKWYKKSLELGLEGAEARLAALRAWTETAAEQGNMKAEQLLLVWE
jgi:TPR repeat protein